MKFGRILSLILFVWLCLIAWTLVNTGREFNIDDVADYVNTGEKGFYLVDQKKDVTTVLLFDSGGKAKAMKTLRSDGVSTKIVQADVTEDYYFYIEDLGIKDDSPTRNFALNRIDTDLKRKEHISNFDLPWEAGVNNLCVSGGKAIITAIAEKNTEILVYELSLKKGSKEKLLKKVLMPLPRKCSEATYNGDILYVLADNGDILYFGKTDEGKVDLADRGTAEFIIGADDAILAKIAGSGENVYIKGDVAEFLYDNEDSIFYNAFGKTSAMLCSDKNGSNYIITQDASKQIKRIDSLELPLTFLFKMSLHKIAVRTLIYLIIAIVFIIAFNIYVKSKSMIPRVIVVTAVLVLIMNGIMNAYILNELTSNIKRERMEFNYSQAEIVHEKLRSDKTLFFDDLELKDFARSSEYERARSFLDDNSIAFPDRPAFSMRQMIVNVESDSVTLAAASVLPYGKDLKVFFPEELLESIRSGKADEAFIVGIMKKNHTDYAYAFTALDEKKPYRNYLVSECEAGDLYYEVMQAAKKQVAALLISGLLESFFLALLLYFFLKPIRDLSNKLVDISMGDYEIKPKARRMDEMGIMWKNLSTVCSVLRAKQRVDTNLQQAASRYVPMNMEDFFGCELQRIEPGDERVFRGDVCSFSISAQGQKGRMSPKIDVHHPFGSEFSSAISIMEEHSEGGISVFLGAGGKHSLMMVFHPQYKSPCTFIVSLLGEAVLPESYCVFLRNAEYKCTVVGTEKTGFLSVRSESFDAIEEKADFFENAGCRFVCSEEVIIPEEFRTRHIGYFADDMGRKVRTIEILDPLERTTLNRRLATLSLFEKALASFQAGRYYEAKIDFSKVLEIDESDGMAAYYLHICEEADSPDRRRREQR